MPIVLTVVICGVSAVLMVLAGLYAWRDRLIDDTVLITAIVLVIALLVALGFGLVGLGTIASGSEKATFIAYLATLPFVPAITAYLAIKEKTRWSMGAIAVGAFAVFVMMARVQQIWNLHAAG